MKNIQRLSLDMQFAKSQYKSDENGNLVYYAEHAAIVAEMQEQVQKLADEVESIREQAEAVYAAGYNHGHLNTVDGMAYDPGVKDDFYPNALQVMAEAETPATDEVIREIGAKAVEGFGEYTKLYHSDSSRHATGYAAKLRAGDVS